MKPNRNVDPRWKLERAWKNFELSHDFMKDLSSRKKTRKEQQDIMARLGQAVQKYSPPERNISISSTHYNREEYDPEIGGFLARNSKQEKTLQGKDPTYHEDEFLHRAVIIYKKAHNLLNDYHDDKEKTEECLHKYVTDYAFKNILEGMHMKTTRWTFVEMLEPAKVIKIINFDMLKENSYCQITVRFYTKQILAIYDRFGRLMLGNDRTARVVEEFVVYEKHTSDTLGVWRMHGKIFRKAAGERKAMAIEPEGKKDRMKKGIGRTIEDMKSKYNDLKLTKNENEKKLSPSDPLVMIRTMRVPPNVNQIIDDYETKQREKYEKKTEEAKKKMQKGKEENRGEDQDDAENTRKLTA